MTDMIRAVAGRALCCLALALAAAGGAVVGAQAPAPVVEQTLVVAGDVTQPLTLQPADLKTMPRTTVTVSEEGREIKYEGVLVGELLKRAGAPVGRDLSGKAVASYVRASATRRNALFQPAALLFPLPWRLHVLGRGRFRRPSRRRGRVP